jgi:hypothetical protein
MMVNLLEPMLGQDLQMLTVILFGMIAIALLVALLKLGLMLLHKIKMVAIAYAFRDLKDSADLM